MAPRSGFGASARTACGSLRIAPLASPLEQDVIRVEAQVQRVVAQEALGVDVAGQLPVVTTLEGGEVASPDLGVPLGPVQVDALALARRQQSLRQARSRR